MKKKSHISMYTKVVKYLDSKGPSTAAAIQKALNIKTNVYTMLQTMIKRGDITKANRLYMTSQEGEVIDRIMNPNKYADKNPYLETLINEREHIMQGIQQLQITANYLSLRIREFQRANSKT